MNRFMATYPHVTFYRDKCSARNLYGGCEKCPQKDLDWGCGAFYLMAMNRLGDFEEREYASLCGSTTLANALYTELVTANPDKAKEYEALLKAVREDFTDIFEERPLVAISLECMESVAVPVGPEQAFCGSEGAKNSEGVE